MTREFLLETMTDQNMHQLRRIVEQYDMSAEDAQTLFCYLVDAKTLYTLAGGDPAWSSPISWPCPCSC